MFAAPSFEVGEIVFKDFVFHSCNERPPLVEHLLKVESLTCLPSCFKRL